MDFFARQDLARRKTKSLIVYFVLAVLTMVALIYGVAIFVKFYLLNGQSHHFSAAPPAFAFWDYKLFAAVAFGTLAVIFCGSAWKTLELSAGGSAVAESLGGRLVNPGSSQPDERKLLNIVEEMSIASGVPMPQVYVLEQEDGINAFAAGHTPADAAIGVTRNAMTKLSRDELQGVIGHEFSHILNGDMRLNLRLMGILFGILCIATIGRILLNVRSSSSRDKNPLPFIGILLLAIGALGLFFGRLIQAAVSRQREFLADASAVQFTRNPAGLSGALQKVGGYGSRLWSPHAPDASHLFFGNALTASFTDMLSTHPPLEERIQAIDPAWDGKFQRLPDDRVEKLFERAERKSSPPRKLFETALAVGAMDEARGVRPNAVLPALGNPTPLHLKYAEELRELMPENLRAAAREPLAATALIYALLLAGEGTTRADQLAEIARNISPALSEKTAALFPEVSSVAQRARLPLVNLALGALRNLDPRDYARFMGTLDGLIQGDGQVELFEYVLQKIVRHQLAPKFSGTRPPAVQFYTLKPLVPDCVAILSALAYVGSAEASAVAQAFATGVPYLRAPAGMPMELLARAQCGVETIGAALDRLALSAPIIRKNLLEACARVVGADGLIHEPEAELLRAVAEVLDCPIPPLDVEENVPAAS